MDCLSLSLACTWCGYEVPGMILSRNLQGVIRLDRSEDVCACFNLHQLRCQRINASYGANKMCVFYVSLQK